MKKRVVINDLNETWHQRVSGWMKTDPGKIKISSILKVLYLPAGIFIYQKIKSFSMPYLILLYFLFICNTCGVVMTINNENSQPLENLYFFSSGSTVLISLLIGRYHKDYMLCFYAEVKEHQKSEEFVDLSNTFIRKRIKYASITISFLVLLIAVVPLYAVLFTDAKTDDLIVLIYPMWYPYKIDTIQKYLYSLLFQYISILYGYYMMSFLLGSFAFATLFIRVRLLILKRKILSMEQTVIDGMVLKALNNFDQQFNENMCREFIQIVREHQNLIKFIRQTISCFSFMATVLVAYASMTAVLLITLFLKSDVIMLLKIKLISTSVVAMLSLVACCYCGEVLLNVNKELVDTVYDIPWYGYPIRLRKFIVIFMIQIQKQFEMKSFGMFLLCMSYIATAFRLLYTCIQVLRQRAT